MPSSSPRRSIVRPLLRCVLAVVAVGGGIAFGSSHATASPSADPGGASDPTTVSVDTPVSDPPASDPTPTTDPPVTEPPATDPAPVTDPTTSTSAPTKGPATQTMPTVSSNGYAHLSVDAAGTIEWGEVATMVATVTDQSGSCTHDPGNLGCDVPEGYVQFYDNRVPIPGAKGLLAEDVFPESSTVVYVSGLDVGTHYISAAYIPGNFDSVSETTYARWQGYSALTVTKTGCSLAMTVGTVDTTHATVPVPFIADLGGPGFTGNVAFYDSTNNVYYGSVAITDGRSATFTASIYGSGSKSFYATYLGDSHHTACTSASASYTIPAGSSAHGEVRTPVPEDDTYDIAAGAVLNADVLSNDDLGNGMPLTSFTITQQPEHGTASVTSYDTIVYTPATGFTGVDTLQYSFTDVDDIGPYIGPGRVTINVACVTSATADAYAVHPGGSLTQDAAGGVLANDTPCGAQPSVVDQPAHGTLDFHPDGGFAYTPAADFVGDDTFTYQLTQPAPASGVEPFVAATPTTVTLHVTDTACVTDLADDRYTATDGVLQVDAPGVILNDAVCGSTLVATSQPAHGTVTFRANGSLDYTADAGYSGPDEFTYGVAVTTVQAEAAPAASATVHIDVTLTATTTTSTTTTTTTPTTTAAPASTDAITTSTTIAVAAEAPAATTTTSSSAPASTSPAPTGLPATGFGSTPLVLAAGALLPLGLLCIRTARRRPAG